jgi:hypothetical protein
MRVISVYWDTILNICILPSPRTHEVVGRLVYEQHFILLGECNLHILTKSEPAGVAAQSIAFQN